MTTCLSKWLLSCTLKYGQQGNKSSNVLNVKKITRVTIKNYDTFVNNNSTYHLHLLKREYFILHNK